jgi:small subunit ribosomal protein S6
MYQCPKGRTMTATKHIYETTFIVNASLEDPQIETVLARAQEAIAKAGGEITALNKWGRKRMLYSIKKKNNGFYVNIEMLAPPTLSKELERFYILEEAIIRFLTIRVDKRGLKAREVSLARAAEEAQAAAAIAPAPVATGGALFEDEPAS